MKYLRTFCCLVSILFSLTILHAQGSHWDINPYDYKYDMTIYANLVVDDSEVIDFSNYEVAAFVDNECRGVGEVQSKDSKSWIYLRVRSNTANGETLKFKLYDKSLNRTANLEVSQPIIFASQGMVGTPSSPITLTKPSYILGDVNGDGIINVADVVCVRIISAGGSSPEYNLAAADANGDGIINVADAVTIILLIANK